METSTDTKKPGLAPPYAPFRTLQALVERMEKEGDVPARLDRSYLSNIPWGSQDQLMQACRSLELIDSNDQPTQRLKDLVHHPDERKQRFRQIIEARYPEQLALGSNATQDQLDEVFKAGGISGATLTKAVRFFLHAAQYAEISVSRHFKPPRAEPGPRKTNGKTRRQARSKPEDGLTPPPPPQSAGEGPELIRNLLKQLPPEGATWNRAKAKVWLTIAESTFDLVYSWDDGSVGASADKSSAPGVDGGGDD